jgi:hypothetical protein
MTAFAISLVVSYFYPSLEAPLYFLAISISVSRVVLGMHFLSDVLAGALLGSALGVASLVAFASTASSNRELATIPLPPSRIRLPNPVKPCVFRLTSYPNVLILSGDMSTQDSRQPIEKPLSLAAAQLLGREGT